MNGICDPTTFPIKTLIVDDTSLMRRAIQQILDKDDRIEVVGMAVNGQQCVEKIPLLKPDVITLDIDMPVMNGITTIKHIMVRHQIPIVIVSSLIQDGYFAFEALRLGVVDFIPKPSRISVGDWGRQEDLLRQRVLMGSCMQIHRMRRVRRRKPASLFDIASQENPPSIVVMGTTLAGPNSVMRIVTNLSPQFSGSIIALQEIHPSILVPFSSCFNDISSLEVIPVVDTCPLRSGKVYMASIFSGLIIEEDPKEPDRLILRVTEATEYPINQLFESAAHRFKNRTCGVLLTGTGIDGSKGMQFIRERGGLTVGQEQDCCVYPNLVEHAVRNNVLDVLIPDRLIASFLSSWTESGTERVRSSVLHDPLTDLPNRNLFIDRANQAIARAHRHQKSFAFLCIGMNRFKAINESWGYDVGDRTLKEVADRLRNCVRAVDTIARLEGDEFVILLEEFENLEDASRVAQRILARLDEPFRAGEHQFEVNASIGISAYPSDGTNVDILIRNARDAMRSIKDIEEGGFLFYQMKLN